MMLSWAVRHACDSVVLVRVGLFDGLFLVKVSFCLNNSLGVHIVDLQPVDVGQR